MIEADDRQPAGAKGAFCAGLPQRLTPVTEQAYRELSISDAEGWRRRLTSYQRPNDWRSLFELAATVLPLGFCWLIDAGRAPVSRLLALRISSLSSGGISRSPVHDPARLWTRRFLRQRDSEPLGRSAGRGADADPLRPLAAHSRHSSRDLRQPRSPRDRRHQHSDVGRVPRAIGLGPTELSALPPPGGHVRAGAGLCLFP